MLIIINNPTRNDKKELDTNANYLREVLPNHKRIYLSEGINVNEHDGNNELNIIAHGSPIDVGSMAPSELAKSIGTYINGVFDTYNVIINKINIYACNTGREYNGEQAYAEKFALLLSHEIRINTTIEINAPNGILVFYPNGEFDVLRDENPFGTDKIFVQEVNEIFTDDIEKAKGKVKPLLVKGEPFSIFTSVPIKNLLKAAIDDKTQIEQNNMNDKTPSFYESNHTFFMSSETYSWLTKQYSIKESEDDVSYQKNMRVFGLKNPN